MAIMKYGWLRSFRSRQYGWLNVITTGGASNPLVDNLVYDIDLLTNTTASVGSDPSYSRTGTIYRADSKTSTTSFGTDVVPFGRRFGSLYNFNGYIGQASYSNLCLQSEDITTTWTSVGSPTLTANDANAPDGNATADKILANANGEGINQDMPAAPAVSRNYQFSFWAKSAGASNVPITFTVGGSGGTPETQTETTTVPTSWRRVYATYKSFTASATGNVNASITVDTSGDSIHVWGMQLIQNAAGTKLPLYMPTTTATAGTNFGALTVASGVLTPEKGSAALWFANSYDGDTPLGGNNATRVLFTMGAGQLIGIEATGASFYVRYNGSALSVTGYTGLRSDRYYHACYTWDNTVPEYILYINGVELFTNTSAQSVPAEAATYISSKSTGRDGNLLPVNRFKLYNTPLSSSDVTTLYNSESSNYVHTYDYGYPAGGHYEKGVAAQWDMSEASGNIIDEVGAISIPNGGGSPTYSVSGTGDWSAFTGITGTTTNDWFGAATAYSQLAPGTDDWIFECVFSVDSSDTGNGRYLIYTEDTAASDQGWSFWVNNGTDTVQFRMEATDGTAAGTTLSYNNLGDGEVHKLRFVCDRSGNLEVFEDGVSLGTAAISTLSGKTIPAPKIYIGRNSAGGGVDGTIYEARVTVGNLYNNSGGPSGG